MQKKALKLEQLNVTSFLTQETAAAEIFIAQIGKCTGCVSGCGIISE